MTKAQLILAMVAQGYHLGLVPNHPLDVEPLFTLRPRYGRRMTLEPLSKQTAGPTAFKTS